MSSNKPVSEAIGTKADIAAGVDISKVHGGYFASKENADEFIKIGIVPIEEYLPKVMTYLDFGGGHGFLTKAVKDYLVSKGHKVNAIVVDANPDYLKKAKTDGLPTELTTIHDCKLKNADLITMRAVIHYNNPELQQDIFDKTFETLKDGGYLVHQNSSGTKENCELRSTIVNMPSLGIVRDNEHYKWILVDDCLIMLKKAGFKESEVAGYAPSNSWGPEEQWDRFNKKITDEAKSNNNTKALSQIENNRNTYLKEAKMIIEDYIRKFSNKELGAIKKSDNSYLIEYTYPIIVSKKK